MSLPSCWGSIGDLTGPAVMDDRPIRPSDFAGKVVVINIWGSWCAPCRTETPELEKMFDETEPLGVAQARQPVARCLARRCFGPLVSMWLRDVSQNGDPILFDPHGVLAARAPGHRDEPPPVAETVREDLWGTRASHTGRYGQPKRRTLVVSRHCTHRCSVCPVFEPSNGPADHIMR